MALGLLWFAAVFVDYVHSMLLVGNLKLIGELAEEGGEHVGASLFLWTCILGVAEQRRRKPYTLALPPVE